jgi:serine/threonine protein kinase
MIVAIQFDAEKIQKKKVKFETKSAMSSPTKSKAPFSLTKKLSSMLSSSPSPRRRTGGSDGAASNASEPLIDELKHLRFLSQLGTGAQGVILLASDTRLESVVRDEAGQLLFPGPTAPYFAHESAATVEYGLRHPCVAADVGTDASSDSADAPAAADAAFEDADSSAPLYVAVKRIQTGVNAAAVVSRDTPASPQRLPKPGSGRSLADIISDTSVNSSPDNMRRSLTDNLSIARYNDEAKAAVSILRASSVAGSGMTNEIMAMAKLKHTNIVRLYGAYLNTEANALFVATEFVSGGDLASAISKGLIARDAAGRERYARQTIHDVCSALEYMHRNNVAHRDLKPANVLVGPPIKVCDLGFTNETANMRTKLGTPDYMAPEVVLADGTKPYTPLIDCWSLGVMVFELVSKAHFRPFSGRTHSMLTEAILRHEQTLVPLLTLLAEENCSDDCIAFISALLCDVRARLSARQALQHPWLATCTPGTSVREIPPSPGSSSAGAAVPPAAGVSEGVPSRLFSRPSSLGTPSTTPKKPRGLAPIAEE